MLSASWYGPNDLRLEDKAIPKVVPGSVLVKVKSCAICGSDLRILGEGNSRISPPHILGHEISGEVVEVGEGVTNYAVGDRVATGADVPCGKCNHCLSGRPNCCDINYAIGYQFDGGYAEYICLPENSVVATIPAGMSYEEAAPISNGGITALRFLRIAKLQKKQKILIYGASGSVGTFTTQLAKTMSAEITGVCSTTNMAMVQSLGADQVIDYTQEDFTKTTEKYDVVFDAVGKASPSDCKSILKPGGVYLNVLRSSGGLKLKLEELQFLQNLMEKGQFTSVIDKRFTLDQIVEAHHYVDKGHKKGNVVITVGSES